MTSWSRLSMMHPVMLIPQEGLVRQGYAVIIVSHKIIMRRKSTFKIDEPDVQDDKILQDSYKLMMMMNYTQDLEVIYSKLTKLNAFNTFIESYFQNSNRENLLQICSHLKMEHFSAGDVIFKEGDHSNDKLYIIYSGSVLLLRKQKMDQLQADLQKDLEQKRKQEEMIQKAKEEEEQEQQEEQEKQQQQVTSVKGLIFAKKAAMKFMMTRRKGLTFSQRQELISQYGSIIRTLCKGDEFGIRALLKNERRSLTVAAGSGHLFLVVLKKEDFQQVSNQVEQEIKDKQQLIFQVFKGIKNSYSTTRLESIVYSFVSVEFDRNSVITQEDEPGERFFIIQKGELKLSKQLQVLNSSRKTHNLASYNSVQISTLLPGQLLGEEIVMSKNSLYEYTSMVVSQKATLMVVTYSEFHMKFPEECRQQIIQGYKKKKLLRNEMCERMMKNRSVLNFNEAKPDEFSQIQSLSQLDNNSIKRELLPNQIKVPNNFVSKYQNQSVQDYCIKKIVKEQEFFLKKNNTNIYALPATQPEPYDFGKTRPEDIRKKKHLFELKLNIKNAQSNFLSQSERTLPFVIRRDFQKTQKRKKKNFTIHSFLHVKTQPSGNSKSVSTFKFNTQENQVDERMETIDHMKSRYDNLKS